MMTTERHLQDRRALATPRETGRRVGPQDEFAIVPAAVIEHPRLGAPAVRIWAYCWLALGRPRGWILRKFDIRRKCRVGEHAWCKAIQELTDAGLYCLERGRRPAGSVNDKGENSGGQATVEHVFYWPGYGPMPVHLAAPQKSGGRSTTPRLPGGISTDARHQRKKEEALRTRDIAYSLGSQGSAAEHRVSYSITVTGIWCWNDGDRAAAAEIERVHDHSAIIAAVAALSLAGKQPVPGTVVAELRRSQQVQAAEDRRVRAERDRLARMAQHRCRQDRSPMAEAAAREAQASVARLFGDSMSD